MACPLSFPFLFKIRESKSVGFGAPGRAKGSRSVKMTMGLKSGLSQLLLEGKEVGQRKIPLQNLPAP